MVVEGGIIDISIGGSFGTALDRDGLIWSWGSNSNGELGIGDYEAKPYPYPVSHLKTKNI